MKGEVVEVLQGESGMCGGFNKGGWREGGDYLRPEALLGHLRF